MRVACLVAGVSRNPGDESDINPKERLAYRELIEALQVSDEELSEIQWAAKEELQQKRSLLNVILDAIYGKDGWPDQALLPPDFPMIWWFPMQKQPGLLLHGLVGLSRVNDQERSDLPACWYRQ